MLLSEIVKRVNAKSFGETDYDYYDIYPYFQEAIDSLNSSLDVHRRIANAPTQYSDTAEYNFLQDIYINNYIVTFIVVAMDNASLSVTSRTQTYAAQLEQFKAQTITDLYKWMPVKSTGASMAFDLTGYNSKPVLDTPQVKVWYDESIGGELSGRGSVAPVKGIRWDNPYGTVVLHPKYVDYKLKLGSNLIPYVFIPNEYFRQYYKNVVVYASVFGHNSEFPVTASAEPLLDIGNRVGLNKLLEAAWIKLKDDNGSPILSMPSGLAGSYTDENGTKFMLILQHESGLCYYDVDSGAYYLASPVDATVTPMEFNSTEIIINSIDNALKELEANKLSKTEADEKYASNTFVDESLQGKVDKVEGKQLSTIDLTNELLALLQDKYTKAEINGLNSALQQQIDAIKLILTSDDVDFDTLQELVNALKNNVASISGIFTALSTKADKADVPTKLSQLENDANYTTNDFVKNVRIITNSNTLIGKWKLTSLNLLKDAMPTKVRIPFTDSLGNSYIGITIYRYTSVSDGSYVATKIYCARDEQTFADGLGYLIIDNRDGVSGIAVSDGKLRDDYYLIFDQENAELLNSLNAFMWYIAEEFRTTDELITTQYLDKLLNTDLANKYDTVVTVPNTETTRVEGKWMFYRHYSDLDATTPPATAAGTYNINFTDSDGKEYASIKFEHNFKADGSYNYSLIVGYYKQFGNGIYLYKGDTNTGAALEKGEFRTDYYLDFEMSDTNNNFILQNLIPVAFKIDTAKANDVILPTYKFIADNYVNKDESPTKTSQLENDSGFITKDDIPTKASQLENDNFYIQSEVIEENPTTSKGGKWRFKIMPLNNGISAESISNIEFNDNLGNNYTMLRYTAGDFDKSYYTIIGISNGNEILLYSTNGKGLAFENEDFYLVFDSNILGGINDGVAGALKYYADKYVKVNYAKKEDLFSRSYNDLKDKPIIPSKTSQLTNDSSFVSQTEINKLNEKINNIKPDNIKPDAIIDVSSVDKIGATPVPTSGLIEKVYLNTELSHDKVVEICKGLNYLEYDGTVLCPIACDSALENAVFVGKGNFDGIDVYQIWHKKSVGDDILCFTGLDAKYSDLPQEIAINFGWDKSFNGIVEINLESAVSILAPQFNFTPVNDRVANLFSATPFANEQVVYRVSSWQGTVVPNSGYVEKVYFNTSLSVEEVVNLLNSLTLVEVAGQTGYIFLTTADGTGPLIVAMIMDGLWGIGDFTDGTVFFASGDTGLGFVGWNPDISYPYVINADVSNILQGASVGAENNLLTNLLSTTPFIGTTPTLYHIKNGVKYEVGKNNDEKINQIEEKVNENSGLISELIDRGLALENNKVDKVEGKQLSTNDYTNADKAKLDGFNFTKGIPSEHNLLGGIWVAKLNKDYTIWENAGYTGSTTHIYNTKFKDSLGNNFTQLKWTLSMTAKTMNYTGIKEDGTEILIFRTGIYASLEGLAAESYATINTNYWIRFLTNDPIMGSQIEHSWEKTAVSIAEIDADELHLYSGKVVTEDMVYTKDEVYTKDKVLALINNISTMSMTIVETLPTENISNTTIYLLLKSSGETANIYDEYIYINNAWELIGNTQLSLDNYYTKTQVDSLIANNSSGGSLYHHYYVINNTMQPGLVIYFDIISSSSWLLNVKTLAARLTGVKTRVICIINDTTQYQGYIWFDSRSIYGYYSYIKDGALADQAVGFYASEWSIDTTNSKVIAV